MRPSQTVGFDPDGADIGCFPTVEALAFVEDSPTHGFFFHVVVVTVDQRPFRLQLFFRILSFEFFYDLFKSFGTFLFALSRNGDRIRFGIEVVVYFLTQIFVVLLMAIFTFNRFSACSFELFLNEAVLFDGFMRHLDGFEHLALLHFAHLAFYHHDIVIRGADHDVDIGLFELRKGRVDDKLAVDTCHTHFRDRSSERDVGNGEGCRGGQSGQCVRHIFTVGREKYDVYKYFSMIIVREQRTEYAVD